LLVDPLDLGLGLLRALFRGGGRLRQGAASGGFGLSVLRGAGRRNCCLRAGEFESQPDRIRGTLAQTVGEDRLPRIGGRLRGGGYIPIPSDGLVQVLQNLLVVERPLCA